MTSYAQPIDPGLGQLIRINTHFQSFVGRSSLTIIVRDLDHNQTIPYLFDITRGRHHWAIYTYGRNYLITASRLQIVTYQPWCNTYKQYWINNFCHLESRGRIIRGEAMHINVEGNLSPNTNNYACRVSLY